MNSDRIKVLITLIGREFELACSPDDHDMLLETSDLLDQQLRTMHGEDNSAIPDVERLVIAYAMNSIIELKKKDEKLLQIEERIDNLLARLLAMKSGEEPMGNES